MYFLGCSVKSTRLQQEGVEEECENPYEKLHRCTIEKNNEMLVIALQSACK